MPEASLETAVTEGDLSSEHEITSISSGEVLPREITQRKDTKIFKEDSAMTKALITFDQQVKHMRKKGEATIRIKSLVDSLGIEENPRLSRSQKINKDCEEMISHLDYLVCAGLDFGTNTKPFIQSIETLYDRSLKFGGWIKVCKNVLRTHASQWDSISSVLFAIYAKEAISNFKQKHLAKIIDYSMRCAMKKDNYLLAFEIVKTYFFDHIIQMQGIIKGTKGISPIIIDIVLQISRKMMLRNFPNLKNNAIALSFCRDRGHGNRLVTIMTYKGIIDIDYILPKEVLGFKLVLYNFSQPSEEALIVFQSVSKKTQLPTVTEGEARELFRKHSNLTMISASPYKSMGYSKGKHRTVEKLCISLFCFHKGYIPYGEEEFPKTIRNVEVDVQEGHCYFGTGRSLESGGLIKRLGSGSSGSIGGFVDLPNDKVGMITCAHVVLSSEELFMLTNRNPPGTNVQFADANIEVEAFDKERQSYSLCGKCVRADFPPCDQIGCPSNTNVDAALIELNRNIDTFEFWTVPSEQCQSSGFDPMNPLEFYGDVVSLPNPEPVYRYSENIPDSSDIVVKYVTANGKEIGQEYLSNPGSEEAMPLSDQDPVFKVSGVIPNKLERVIKYGAETRFTIGILYHNPVHVRFIQERLNLPGNSHCAVMCDQIEIQNLPQGLFFDVGDSGSFVFCINPDKTLSCLGMAVGLTTRKSCLVTPIGRVLEKLCPGADLKRCPSSATFQGALHLILGEMKKMRSGFQTTLKNVETSLRSDFQASLQNVQIEVQSLKSKVTKIEDSKPHPSGANQN